jgi:hypothetical protein
LGEKWIGGGQKINLVLKELENYKNDLNKIILITDRYSFYLYLDSFFLFFSEFIYLKL